MCCATGNNPDPIQCKKLTPPPWSVRPPTQRDPTSSSGDHKQRGGRRRRRRRQQQRRGLLCRGRATAKPREAAARAGRGPAAAVSEPKTEHDRKRDRPLTIYHLSTIGFVFSLSLSFFFLFVTVVVCVFFFLFFFSF